MKRQKNDLSDFRFYFRKARQRHKLGEDLSLEDLKVLWDRQAGKCAYTGIALIHNSGAKQDKRFLASLDRIDSALPYQAGNVQFVSAAINFAKSDMSHEHFVEFISLIRRTAPASVASPSA